MDFFMDFQAKFIQNFIDDNRWLLILYGLRTTLTITFFALILGVCMGFLTALVRVTYDKTGKLRRLNTFARFYLTVVRGTPMLVQLMIIYYVIFSPWPFVNSIIIAVIAFGINSGAYVAEIFRSGIMSIDPGQMEAGRSLGLTYNQTMRRIITPQAIKNVLPALGNESISLLKETSVAGYIGIRELTRSGDIIRSRTYEAFFPLIAVAAIYLCLVLIMTAGVSRLERRLAVSDRR
ncbi:MAG: amino acid ABC transporter permease [Oscillospiraceae bacterium]|nr:amino acid ABC transporter permease [Oscillospiraceae bacterium]